MKPHELIVALCHETGDSRPEDDLVEEWEINHACCCTLNVDKAARGDISILDAIRGCMGLPSEEEMTQARDEGVYGHDYVAEL